MQSVTPECTHSGLGSSAFARRYLRNRVFFLFLRVLRCFSSPGSLPYVMDWRMVHEVCSCGFPHSDISGSMDICSSPKLIAAYHVFHRLLVPSIRPAPLITWPVIRVVILKTFLVYICLKWCHITKCYAVFKVQHGGDEEDVTPDPLRARQSALPAELHPHIYFYNDIYFIIHVEECQ